MRSKLPNVSDVGAIAFSSLAEVLSDGLLKGLGAEPGNAATEWVSRVRVCVANLKFVLDLKERLGLHDRTRQIGDSFSIQRTDHQVRRKGE